MFELVVHFLNGTMATDGPGALNSIQVSYMGTRDPTTRAVFCCLSRSEAEYLGLESPYSNLGYRCHKPVGLIKCASTPLLT